VRWFGAAVLVLGIVGLVLYGWLNISDVKTENANCGPVDDPSETAFQNQGALECMPALESRRDQIRYVGWGGLIVCVAAGGTILVRTRET
jgi:hypothetical protein